MKGESFYLKAAMNEFDRLVEIIDKLLGPGGCPWDQEQTMLSMRSSMLEEVCEVIDAIDLNHSLQMEEELGDLFFNVIFMCKLAEKEGKFTLAEALKHITAKLIRRHPHVFGDAKVETAEGVLKQWDEIKKNEKCDQPSMFSSIPKSLPSLMKAQKMAKILEKINKSVDQATSADPYCNEETLGAELFNIVQQARTKGLDAEQALRNFLTKIENFYS